jgi:MFS transporter, FHS family, glucose/mannose:H+ symporter
MPGRFTSAVLYFTFFFTGICIATPGALLPQLLTSWGMNDAAAGLLLFGFFVGSSLGGLAARGPLQRVLLVGCTLCAMAGFALAAQTHSSRIFLMTVFGFGLGLCMTSISLQRARAHAARRTAELTRLNLVWAAGALAGPSFSQRLAAWQEARQVFAVIAVVFAVTGLCIIFSKRGYWASASTSSGLKARTSRRNVLPLLMMIPLATGLESAAGGWLATYAKRSGASLAGGVGLVTIFWAGFVLCRLVHANERAARHVDSVLRYYPPIAFAGLVLLWATNNLPIQALGAFFVGWGVGSLYPVALALQLAQAELGNLGFLIAGVGSALLPLLTGFISNETHTLRSGIAFLSLPAACLIVLGRICARDSIRVSGFTP